MSRGGVADAVQAKTIDAAPVTAAASANKRSPVMDRHAVIPSLIVRDVDVNNTQRPANTVQWRGPVDLVAMTDRAAQHGISYASAGVDIEAGDRAVELFKPLASKATRPEVRGGLGGFAGLFALRVINVDIAHDQRRYDSVTAVSYTHLRAHET